MLIMPTTKILLSYSDGDNIVLLLLAMIRCIKHHNRQTFFNLRHIQDYPWYIHINIHIKNEPFHN